MRNPFIPLLLLLSVTLPAHAGSPDLAQMDKSAETALDNRVYTVGDVDVTAWVDGPPVIIKVPIFNEKREWQGDSRYYFRQGRLLAVTMPYGRYQFDEQGTLVEWLDEDGAMSELPGSRAWQARAAWLQRRAAQLLAAFEPSQAAKKLQSMAEAGQPQGAARVAYLCRGQLAELIGAKQLRQPEGQVLAQDGFWQGRLEANLKGEWLPLQVDCRVAGDQVTRLTFRPVPAGK